MAAISRNEPCPCGSGKKYKACCLAADEAARRGEAELAPDNGTFQTRMFEKLMEFGERSYQRVFKEGRDIFLRLDDFNEEDLKEEDLEIAPLDEDEEFEWMTRMMNGILFDLPAGPDGEVIAEAYLRRMSARLADDERAWLREMVNAPLTPLELVEVQPGVGFRARDLWTGDERFISESIGSRELAVGDLLAARVTREADRFLLEVGAYSFPPGRKAEVEAEMAKYLKENDAATVGDLEKAQVRLFSIVLHALWNELTIAQENAFDPDSPEVRANLGLDLLESSHRDWIDSPLTGLDGQTPRAAARSSEGRTEVAGMLRLAEARALDSGDSPVDFAWIRKELRLPPE